MQNPMRLGKSQDVALSTTNTVCASAFGLTTIVRLVATQPCYVAFGATPTAVVGSSAKLAPNFPEYFLVRPGEKVAAIEPTGGVAGTLTVTEMTK